MLFACAERSGGLYGVGKACVAGRAKGGVAYMRFDLEPFRQFLALFASYSPPTLFAAGGAVLAAFVVMYGALLGTGESAAEADAVAVAGPMFKPVSPPTPALAAHRSDASAAPRFEDERSLARAIQAELKRAGCYSGPVNGIWSASTRAGMGEFAGRVNARLPVGRADPVLLALLETHNKISCTDDCTTGGEESCVARSAEPPVRRNEVAGVEQKRPAKAELREDVEVGPPPVPPTPAKARAEDLGFSTEEQRVPNPIASVQTASTEPEDVRVTETSALPAAVAPAPRITKPERRRASRKYRKQPSLSRQVSRGFRQIQRSLNKLF